MGNKKKRSHNASSSAVPHSIASQLPHTHSPDKLDYSDEQSDPPLDSKEYQQAIKAHLSEFEDMATNSTNGHFGKDGIEGLNDMLSQAVPKLSSVSHSDYTLNHESVAVSAKSKKKAIKHNQESSKDRIWNTTTNEERERIKEFWLNLGEEERKSLVKVEKEAVLKKMKEQQKHSCSCSVCGRKRTAIEEELEVLYDAYYEELEQYANQQQFPSQSSLSSSRPNIHRAPRQSKITEVLGSENSEASFEDEELESDDLLTDDDLSEDDYSEEEYEERAPAEFFKFGNSLTVKGGILTVADDLLRNDGKKFIEMMEQLAERRMQREEEAAMEAREYDEDEDEEYEDDDIDSELYDDEEEEQDLLTEEQRMAEGRRMFQIFAARMFEQRVLTAYREKVAQERQARLLQELEMEDSRERERELKKQKEKEKKKDKKRQQQAKKEEEKLRKESEKAAEEAAIKAEEERKAEELRKRKEEIRLKKETEKKLADAERLRKEDDKRKRLAEEKLREQKKLEQIAKEKKEKDEALRKERELREAAAKEARVKKEQLKAQKDAENARLESQSNGTTQSAVISHKISPTTKPSSPAVGTSPAVPKAHAPTKEVHTQTRKSLDLPVTSPAPIGLTNRQHRALTPGAISPRQGMHPQQHLHQPPHNQQQQQQQQHPSQHNQSLPQQQHSQQQQQHHQQQYVNHQNPFPRSALGHPPPLPVPLPPPGIGSHSNSSLDPFGFNSSQQTHMHYNPNLPVTARPNVNGGHSHLPVPPGVFPSGLSRGQPASPPSRVPSTQASRLGNPGPFSPFGGIGMASNAIGRDELPAETDLNFGRRAIPATEHPPVGTLGSVKAIGRPTPARVVSQLPAPIQRPASGAPQRSRYGFDKTNDVMGSRALLDDDDPVFTASKSIFTSHPSSDTWSAKPSTNGWSTAAHPPAHHVDEQYSSALQPPSSGRWGSVGSLGAKTPTTPFPDAPAPFLDPTLNGSNSNNIHNKQGSSSTWGF